MKKLVVVFCFCFVIAHSLLGIGVLDKAPGLVSEAKERITDYMTAQNDSLLKSYNPSTGKWENWSGTEKANVYIISHGLNDQHDADWINKTAKSMAEITKNDPNAVVLTVNWDHFSGTSQDKNFLASTWINAVAELINDSLKGSAIKQAVGHSYGTHLLANVISKHDSTVDSFVALDPAEERGTLVSASSIWDTTTLEAFWKKAADKTHVETYKSSVVFGSEIPLGDENYLLASPGQIDPLSSGGDWDGGAGPNHTLATTWYVDMVEQKVKEVAGNKISSAEALSHWFSDDVKAGTITTDEAGNSQKENGATGPGTWTGIVNTQKGDTLEYLLPESKATSLWANVFTLFGMSIADWQGTVLNPGAKADFDKIDKTELFKVQTFKDGDNNEWKYDPLTGRTYKNGVEVQNGFDLGQDWESTPDPSSLQSPSEILDTIMKDAESAGKDALDDALDIFKETWKNSTGSIWDKLKQSIGQGVSGGIQALKGNLKALVVKYLTWQNFENLINYGLQHLLAKNPVLAGILNKLGLDNINNIIGFCKDIFNLVRGLLNGGSFLELLKNSPFIRNVLANLLQWGLDKVKDFLSGLFTKWANAQWVSNFVNKVLGAFGISTSINFQNLLSKGLDKALNAGTKRVQVIIDKIRPSTKKPKTGDPISTPQVW